MQDYLNRNQIESFAVLRTAEKRLMELLQYAHQMNPKEAEQYRRALTHLCKGQTLTVERLEYKFAKAIVHTADHLDIQWVQANLRTANKEDPSTYVFTQDELDDALGDMMYRCTDCTGLPECKLKYFLLQACVPEFDTENKVCPYAQGRREVTDDGR